MRLTKKGIRMACSCSYEIKHGNVVIKKYEPKKEDVEKCDIYNKLADLEDIEDKLGIDLITLFKALKDGIYTKEYGHLTVISVGLGGLISEVHSIDYYKDVFYYSGYGKTWALTKEELEK